jgi:shikimate dehydrogenase
MREQNVRLLKQNGRIFFIDRDPDKLSTYNRPLSQNGGVFRIYRERFPVYSAVSDERVENNGRSFAPCADKILRIIGA